MLQQQEKDVHSICPNLKPIDGLPHDNGIHKFWATTNQHTLISGHRIPGHVACFILTRPT